MTMDPKNMSSVVNLSGTQSAPPAPSESSALAHDAQTSQTSQPALPERDPPARARVYTQNHAGAQTVSARAGQHSAFVPLLLGGLALLGWLGFQTWQLYSERQALQAAHASQQQTVDGAAKLRASLDTLAADTQRLADGGNPNARALVDELKKRGVTINTAPTNNAPATPAAR